MSNQTHDMLHRHLSTWKRFSNGRSMIRTESALKDSKVDFLHQLASQIRPVCLSERLRIEILPGKGSKDNDYPEPGFDILRILRGTAVA